MVSDVDLLNLIAEPLGLDAVVLIAATDDPPRVRASWPVNRAGTEFDDSTEAGRSRLLIAAGGGGGAVVTATVGGDNAPCRWTIHGSLITPNEISSALAEQALVTLARLIGSQVGPDITRQRVEEASARMVNLMGSSVALGKELSLDVRLLQIVESAHKVFGDGDSARDVVDINSAGTASLGVVDLNSEDEVALRELSQVRSRFGVIFHNRPSDWFEHIPRNSKSVVNLPNSQPLEAFLGEPITSDGEVSGNLFLKDSVSGPVADKDKRMFFAVGSQAIVAMDSVLHFEKEHQRANVLEIEQEIEHAIHAAPGIQQALDVMCAMLGDKLGVDRVKTDTHIDRGHNVKLGSEWYRPNLQPLGPVPDYMAQHATRLAEDLWRSVGSRVMNDYLAPQVHTEGSQVFLRYTNARAAIIVPIMLGDRALGSIYVIMANQPRKWTESEVEIVETVARFVGRVMVDAEFRFQQGEHIDRLEQLERQKSNFVATVSHELRTPLTSIIGFLEMLQNPDTGELTGDQQQMLEVINRNANRLRSLIENLLVLNKSESDDRKDNIADVSMCELITNTCQELYPFAQSHSVELDVDAGSEAAIVKGDRGQLQSVVINIVSNAIKFSHPEGVVSIRCTPEEDTDQIRFTCQDHGIGIPATDQNQLFTQFFRASNAVNQVVPGIGLGLHIVKEIVKNHGGKVHLTSVEGEGTTVTVDFPLFKQASV